MFNTQKFIRPLEIADFAVDRGQWMFEYDWLVSGSQPSIWYVIHGPGVVAEIKKEKILGKPKVKVYGNDEEARYVVDLARGYSDRIEVQEGYRPDNYIKRSFFGISRKIIPKGTHQSPILHKPTVRA